MAVSEEVIFFVDRSLGRKRVPTGLRERGWRLVTLAEHYGIPADEKVLDVEWLKLAGQRGWAVLMKDDRIRYRPAERRALLQNDVRAFCLSAGNLTAIEMIDLFSDHADAIRAACDGVGPSLHVVSRQRLRAVNLTA